MVFCYGGSFRQMVVVNTATAWCRKAIATTSTTNVFVSIRFVWKVSLTLPGVSLCMP